MRSYLEQETIASLLLDSGLDTEGVGNGQIVANNLDAAVGGEVSPGLPVVLVERIFDGDDGIPLDEVQVQIGELGASDPLLGIRVGVLEVKVVFAILIELGRGNIESDLDLSVVTCLLDGFAEKF